MTTQRANFWILALFAATVAYAALVYPSLPDRIPIHWNIRGEVDGWGSRNTIFLGPGLILLGWVMLHGLPKLSPKQFSIDTFGPTFNLIMVLVSGMFAYIGCLIIHAAGHPHIDMGKWMVAGIALFLAALGNLMGKTRRNFYVGIRTPWTLASEKVWDATHRLGGRWMAIGGVAAAVLVLLGAPMLLALAVILVTSLYPVLFSYLYYKRLERSGGL
jgi:uncharacterized membrane protein